MREHAQYAEALALYALGALEHGEERAALEAHLRSCPGCEEELEALYGDAALIALSVAGPLPPARSRARLEEALGSEPRPRRATRKFIVGVLYPRWRSTVPVAATLVLAIFSLMLWREEARLRNRLERAQTELHSQGEKLQRAQAIADLLHAPDVEHITLVAAQTRPQPHVKMMYAPRKGGLLLMASNMESLPGDKVYELWLLPANGGPPMPCGTFRPDTQGNAMMDHSMPIGTEAKAFAITIEPQGGSDQPTMPIVMNSAG